MDMGDDEAPAPATAAAPPAPYERKRSRIGGPGSGAGGKWAETEKELLRVLDAEADVAGMSPPQRKAHIMDAFAARGILHSYSACKAQRLRREQFPSTVKHGQGVRVHLCSACGLPRRGHICQAKLGADARRAGPPSEHPA